MRVLGSERSEGFRLAPLPPDAAVVLVAEFLSRTQACVFRASFQEATRHHLQPTALFLGPALAVLGVRARRTCRRPRQLRLGPGKTSLRRRSSHDADSASARMQPLAQVYPGSPRSSMALLVRLSTWVLHGNMDRTHSRDDADRHLLHLARVILVREHHQ